MQQPAAGRPDPGAHLRLRDGFAAPVTWPHGYVARDAPRRELLDDSGRVVAREGDLVALGGGETGAGPGFVVCGQLDVTPVP